MESRRLSLLMLVFFVIGGVIGARLFSLQILEYEEYYALAQGQHQFFQKLFPQRGEILMQDFFRREQNKTALSPLALNREFKQVFAIPAQISIEDKESLAEELSLLLNLDKEIILERVSKIGDPYEPLKHKVEKETAQKIEDLGVEGIAVAPEIWRYYPHGSLACHLLGFVGMKDEKKIGQYGLEGYYEEELKGEIGFFTGEKDIWGYSIPSLKREFKPAQDGEDLVLTIDENIQFKVEKELAQMVEKWEGTGGTIIVMDPRTGAIRAMANWPVFDPNNYSQVENIDVFLNPAISSVYEPGSVMKPITMAAGLDSGNIAPDTTYHDEGQVRIGGYIIRNVDGKSYNQPTMTEVLEKSINTGAVFVQQKIGPEIFQEYISAFGFGEPTGVDLSGEIGGDISNLFTGREINLANISFGQGIAVTPLELTRAVAAIANGGKLMRPFVVEKRIKPDGSEIVTKPQVVREVISPKTARQLTRMLVSVVENGFGRPARIPGYDIAGKTGTAQVPDPEKGGYSEETIHTFVGYAPAFNPAFVILVKLDKPKGIRFAADSVSPVFKELARYLFNYLEIPPNK